MRTLPFMESEGSREFTETVTVGSFDNANRANDFDTAFTEACENMEKVWGTDFNGGFLNLETLKNDTLVGSFKNDLLAPFEESADQFAQNEELFHGGHAATIYDQLSQLFDNKITEFTESVTNVGNLLPIKTVDFPLMIKNQVQQSFKDVVNEEVSPSLIVKKQIEHHWVYARNNPTQRWEFPQCLFSDEFKEVIEAGKGTKISEAAVPLPLYQYDIIDELTDVTIPSRERVQMDISIDKVAVADGTIVTLPVPMHVNLADGAWIGGRLSGIKYTTAEGEEGVLDDVLAGFMDWTTGTTTLTSANNQVTSVYFKGRLSNERNENTVRHAYTREDIEWKIGEGCKQDAGYSLEQLQEHKALLNMDLYQKTYNDLVMLITQLEDSDGYAWLDDLFEQYKGLDMDPLQWNPMVMQTTFNCDSTIATTALPSEYIAKELKFKIDRFVIDIADTVKMDNLKFVLWGNPRYISLLDCAVKWVFRTGDRIGGVKLDYSYGVMTSGDTSIWVVSSKKINANTHQTLRLLPFAPDKETITFKRYKFSTDVITSKESAYKDPESAGGTMTYVWGSSRYKDVSLQAIQGEIGFENADFITIK